MSVLGNLFSAARGSKSKYVSGMIIVCKDDGKDKRGIVVWSDPIMVHWNGVVCEKSIVETCTEGQLERMSAQVIGTIDTIRETGIQRNKPLEKGDYIAYYGLPAKIADINNGYYKLQFSSQTDWTPGKICFTDGWFEADKLESNLDVWYLTKDQQFQYFLNVPII